MEPALQVDTDRKVATEVARYPEADKTRALA